MKSKYKPYPSYRDSGVEWLNEVPKEWNSSSLKFQLNNLDFRRIPISASERGDIQGHYPYYGASGIIDYVEDYIFSEKTILIGEDGANLLSKSTPLAFIADGKYWVNNHAHILKPKDDLYNFWSYTLNSLDLTSVISGSAQPKLTAEALGNLFVVFPTSLTERQAISNYLDSATAKIDTLIEKQIELIALLKEKRQAVISTAVTRGLDSSVAMKDSGVEWLGEIPEHWDVKKLKYISSVNDDSLPDNTSDELEINYIDIGSVTTGYIQNFETMSYANAPSRARRIIKDGDILVSTVRTYLKAIAPVSSAYNNYIASTGFAVIRSGKELNTNFTKYALLSNYFIDLVESCSVGVSYPAINASDLVTFSISLPSMEEQKEIALYLDTKTSKIDTLIRKATKAIDLLKEKRTALISSAVTGKIDVREIA